MNEKLLLGIVSMLALSSPSVVTAADYHYRNDNAYFSSKYHHKHSYHWQNANKHEGKSNSNHWGRHHHHGIHLEGSDGR